MKLPTESALPEELRELVKESGALLGEVIRKESGDALYKTVESLRAAMAGLRDQNEATVLKVLREQYAVLAKLKPAQRHTVARAFTLLLEVMNACENAYRTHRLQQKPLHPISSGEPAALVYVLTAHPTEARSPQNIEIFHGLQKILTQAIGGTLLKDDWKNRLQHHLEIAWRAPAMRKRAPRVKDEADHIYHMALRPEILSTLLEASQHIVPLYLRTWVGGDKDGHPGVDEIAMKESLALSRTDLLRFAEQALAEVTYTLHLIGSHTLRAEIARLRTALLALRGLKAGDGARVKKARLALLLFSRAYLKKIGAMHPRLRELKRLFHAFPGLVVPLELRESSDVLVQKDNNLAIDRMLKTLALLSKGGEPRWYARGFIVSMTESVEHLVIAEKRMRRALGAPKIPVIPLFETGESLAGAHEIVTAALAHKVLGQCIRKSWGNTMEIMVGYSDSSKQGGALPSRLGIAVAMHRLEALGKEAGIELVFFQGSGGSVDRGGGSVQDQVAWWPRSALHTYKVTIQGEMVERSLSTPEISRGQVARIQEAVNASLKNKAQAPKNPVLFAFAENISAAYKEMIHNPDFLQMVAKATPYPFLSELKIGSRPARRTTEISVEGLRAIPWVLCWTQNRVLFQTWWGVGSSWRKLSEKQKLELQKAFREEPVFKSFVRALDFTIAKSELPIWKIYLEQSSLPKETQDNFYQAFQKELASAAEMVRFVSGTEPTLKPWLGASIRLRAPMIHPLNLLQVLALKEEDFVLFRTTTTGISSGMMTTG